MDVARFSEELWKAAKYQSDLVLAGFLRNICKYDTYLNIYGGTARICVQIFTLKKSIGCGDLVHLTNAYQSRKDINDL